jgi:hypothetical protein
MYREMDTINIINNKLTKEEYDSYIIDFKDNQISLYIPELKHLYRKKLYDNKLLSLLDFNVTKEEITIKNINTNLHIKFNKYQNIKVKLNKKVNNLDVEFKNIDLMTVYNI